MMVRTPRIKFLMNNKPLSSLDILMGVKPNKKTVDKKKDDDNIYLRLRNKLELSQTEFAEKIGVTRYAVRTWENDTSKPCLINRSILYELIEHHLN